MADSTARLQTFAAGIQRSGFTDVVLLGMGGSSLAPDVLRAVIGVAPGWPRFHMLDSTDPAAVRSVATPPDHTLYLLASKSGTTIEPNSLAAHFRQQLQDAGVARWADHFVAITDEGTELDRRARAEHFRDVFINPSDIGGRYSALSFFGMVPAALMGQDVAEIIGWSLAMLAASEPGGMTTVASPAFALGLVMSASASAGRDKLTLVAPATLDAFGLWSSSSSPARARTAKASCRSRASRSRIRPSTAATDCSCVCACSAPGEGQRDGVVRVLGIHTRARRRDRSV
jgi:hypothetical protein